MLPGNYEALLTILLAIAPGYIATVVWARARTWKGSAGDLKTVVQSLALSAVVHLFVAPVTLLWLYPVREHLTDYPERILVWLSLVTVVIPVLLGVIAGYATDLLFDPRRVAVRGRLRRVFTRVLPAPAPPSIWDWLFTARPPHGQFLVVDFRDGRRVAGVFAEGSLALTSPEPQGLFLVSEWVVDEYGDVAGPLPDSRGLMIASMDEVRSIRVLEASSDG